MSSKNFSLNANQAQAVSWNEGPALVLAGPGSGKTAVLTLRAARILGERNDAAILALTFTTKAATEMRERLDKLMGQRADRAHLATFHSFATEILRQHGSHIGLRPDFAVMTLDDDRVNLLEEAVTAIDTVSTLFSDYRNQRVRQLKDTLVLFDRLFAEAYDGAGSPPGGVQVGPWTASLFNAYCARLIASNRLDFGALLHFARRVLTTRPAIATLLRNTWTHVCVDEFQDTNRAQYLLLRMVVGQGKPNLFVVADDDQIIYQWNGASPERLKVLQRDYSMTVIQLPETYRCPPAVVSLANRLIAHNRSRTLGKKALVAGRAPDASNVLFIGTYSSPEAESASVPAEIKRRSLNPGECAVLARTTRLLTGIAQALRAEGFPTHIAQRKTEFECAPVALVYSILRLANARHDRELLRRACVAWQQVAGGLVEVENVAAVSALDGGDFIRAWVRAAMLQAPDALRGWLDAVANHLVERLDFVGLVEALLTTALPGWEDDPDVAEERRTWRELHDQILSEHGAENATLHLYLQEMDLRSKAAPAPHGAVQLLTIHGSKGREFEHVFLVGMAEDQCPSYQAVKRGDYSPEMEEERRNCFVAITRVRSTLTVSRSTTYNGWAKNRSRFLDEMGLPQQ
jgi:DNA helicase-2/ATP-dependent DNA helicase PcrA